MVSVSHQPSAHTSSHLQALQAAQGGFTYSWANPALLHPRWNFRSLTLVQLLPLPRTSFVSTRSHLNPFFQLWDPQETQLLLIIIFILFHHILFCIYTHTFYQSFCLETENANLSGQFWGPMWRHLTARMVYIPISQFLLCAKTQCPLPQTDIKKKNPDMHVLFLPTNKGDSKCNNLAPWFGASNSTSALFDTIPIHQNR